MEMPGQRVDSVQISIRATSQQALEMMGTHQVDLLYVGQTTVAGITSVQGVITRQKDRFLLSLLVVVFLLCILVLIGTMT